MKKYVVITMIVLGVILGGIAYKMVVGNTVTVENIKTEVVEKVVEKKVSELENRIQAAQSASSTEIETKAKKAYEDEKTRLMTEVELEVTRTYRKEVEAREAELEEQVSL